MANYLSDGEHLILDVTMKGKHESDLAIIKEDGTGFKCLLISLDSSDVKETMSKITYVNFTDDGDYILNGYEKTTNALFAMAAHWYADITVSGKHKGFLKVDNVRVYQNKMGSGTIKAQLDGRKIDVDLAKGLPTGVAGELR